MLTSITPAALHQLTSELCGENASAKLFVARLIVHTVEAKAAVVAYVGTDPMELFVLKGIALLGAPTIEELDGVLHLKTQVIRQIIGVLERNHLVTVQGDQYSLTSEGNNAATTGRQASRTEARRIFHLLHPDMGYLAINDAKGRVLRDLPPSEVPKEWSLSPDVIRAYAQADDAWKEACGFPSDVVEIITTSNQGRQNDSGVATPLDASPIIVAKSQAALCAIVLDGGGTDSLGFVSAYGISPHGRLLGPTSKPFFTSRDMDVIESLILMNPAVPTDKATHDAWVRLAELNGLREPSRASCHFAEGRLHTRLPRDLIQEWAPFVKQVVGNGIHWLCPLNESLEIVCPVVADAQDSEAQLAIDCLNLITRLDSAIEHGEVSFDALSLTTWLTMHSGPTHVRLTDLAGIAWDVQNFNVAYRVSEVEDMSDATT